MSAPKAPLRRPWMRRAGFTLVEMLVVLALLSLIMLAMASALRSTGQLEERADERLQRTDEMRTVNRFLHTVLGRISARKTSAPVPEGASPYFFTGAPDGISWVGVMPAQFGAGGRYHFRLGVEPRPGQPSALVIRFAPWTDAATVPDWGQTQAHTLLEQVSAFTVQYEDANTDPPQWLPAWNNPKRLPEHILITLQTPAGDWPAIIIALRILPATDPQRSGPVFGGSG
ncbi:prepilin-type N-terminal cleavage/methylation domain-containing protein [Extensimonas sp. H3M7-6]|uniref:prepilin-type N-terminal cleavage/methylation domain-containing protein n=1 Tax=Extensimonas soli TaxID=3031322 RepID=UPI0023D97B49|nr:prepilin-type N-terminal cleavage/methylation domain-containing protein [Extensimonas sp. H3M7-6]MDF1482625.1 prepilin-type N-terminal cleavage/methylation domain-containing protein [Extensimonas sp. H3M7-6]